MKKIILLCIIFVSTASWATCDTSKHDKCSSASPTNLDATAEKNSVAANRSVAYPPLSRRFGEEGTVVLRILVTPEGKADTVEIRNSSGFQRLDDAAVQAVKSWRFNPYTYDGKAISEWLIFPLSFKLTHEQKKIAINKSNECSPDGRMWEKLAIDDELFIGIISKTSIEPKGMLDKAKQLLSNEETGREFWLVKNNVKLPDGKFGSIISSRIIDCQNHEILIQEESLFSCSYGSGASLPNKIIDTSNFNRWTKIQSGSKDDKLLNLVCQK